MFRKKHDLAKQISYRISILTASIQMTIIKFHSSIFTKTMLENPNQNPYLLISKLNPRRNSTTLDLPTTGEITHG